MTSVSGTGDLHVVSSLTVTQCPKMSQRSSLWLGTKLAAMQHTVWVCRSILHPKRLGLSAEAWEGLQRPPWEGHRHVPQQDSHLKHQARHRVLHISFRSICFSSFQVTDFRNALLSALKGEENPVSMVTTRSWNNFEYMFSKTVTKILSLEG